MRRTRAPGAVSEQSRRVVQHLLGSGDLRVVAAAVALLVGLGWFTDSLFAWLTDAGAVWRGEAVDEWWPLERLVAVVFFPLMLLTLGWLAAGARKHYRPRVGIEPVPAQARGLVLFLSHLKPDQVTQVQSALPDIDGLDAFRRLLGQLNWRMPIEAIAYHRPRLQQVVLICSRVERTTQGNQQPGSIAQLGLFRALAGRVFPGADMALRDVAELDSRYGGGLRFEDVEAVSKATDDALADLLRRGLNVGDVLIDVTGGQKPNAVAATAVALAEGRRIQYVAGDPASGDYHVTVYDITYDR